MIGKYLEVIKKSFLMNITFRIEYFAGIINILLMVFVNVAIWKAIYEEEEVVSGVQFSIVITYIIIGILLQNIFMMDENFIQNKVRSGLIAADFLKPISFRLYTFCYNIGNLLFKILLQFIPTLVVIILTFKLLPPFSTMMAVWFGLSLILGFLILYNLNCIIWFSSFWFYSIFSLVIIKDAIILILSGAVLPLWFMPQFLLNIAKLTPFSSIYYVPLSIYLGQIPEDEILLNFGIQLFWLVFLFGVSQFLWSKAVKKLVVQGG